MREVTTSRVMAADRPYGEFCFLQRQSGIFWTKITTLLCFEYTTNKTVRHKKQWQRSYTVCSGIENIFQTDEYNKATVSCMAGCGVPVMHIYVELLVQITDLTNCQCSSHSKHSIVFG
jgi:hypothetical protein